MNLNTGKMFKASSFEILISIKVKNNREKNSRKYYPPKIFNIILGNGLFM